MCFQKTIIPIPRRVNKNSWSEGSQKPNFETRIYSGMGGVQTKSPLCEGHGYFLACVADSLNRRNGLYREYFVTCPAAMQASIFWNNTYWRDYYRKDLCTCYNKIIFVLIFRVGQGRVLKDFSVTQLVD